MFTSGTTGPSKAVITPWAVMYQFWSWVPDDTLAAGDGLYCTMPLFHNSGRSAFNYAMVHGGRFVIRDKFSSGEFWDDVTRVAAWALAGAHGIGKQEAYKIVLRAQSGEPEAE